MKCDSLAFFEVTYAILYIASSHSSNFIWFTLAHICDIKSVNFTTKNYNEHTHTQKKRKIKIILNCGIRKVCDDF